MSDAYVAPYQPWMDEASALARNAATPFIKGMLLQVIKEFCRKSLAWRDVVTGYTVYEGSRVVPLNPAGNDRKVIHVFAVKVSDTPLGPMAFTESTTAGNQFTGFAANGDDPSEIKLDIPSSETQSRVLSAYVAFEPTDPENCLPELLVTRHYEAIRAGILARIYGHNGMPYADDRMFMVYSRMFNSEIAKARIHGIHGFATGAQPWSYPVYA